MFNTPKRNTTMKKIYQNPEIKTVKVQTAKMVATSTTQIGVSETNYNGSSTVESRNGGSFWDDDEE